MLEGRPKRPVFTPAACRAYFLNEAFFVQVFSWTAISLIGSKSKLCGPLRRKTVGTLNSISCNLLKPNLPQKSAQWQANCV